MSRNQTLTVERILGADPGQVWERLVDGFGEWVGPGSTIEPTPGGAVTGPDGENRIGVVEHAVPGQSLRWVWTPTEPESGDPSSQVEIVLLPTDAGTRIVIRETALRVAPHTGSLGGLAMASSAR